MKIAPDLHPLYAAILRSQVAVIIIDVTSYYLQIHPHAVGFANDIQTFVHQTKDLTQVHCTDEESVKKVRPVQNSRIIEGWLANKNSSLVVPFSNGNPAAFGFYYSPNPDDMVLLKKGGFPPELDDFFKSKGITTLLMAGLWTLECVYYAVNGATKKNYQTYLMSGLLLNGRARNWRIHPEFEEFFVKGLCRKDLYNLLRMARTEFVTKEVGSIGKQVEPSAILSHGKRADKMQLLPA